MAALNYVVVEQRRNNVPNGYADHQVGLVSRARDCFNVFAFRDQSRTPVGFRDLPGRHRLCTAGGPAKAILSAAASVGIAVVFSPLLLVVKIFLLIGVTCVATCAALLAAFRTQPLPAD